MSLPADTAYAEPLHVNAGVCGSKHLLTQVLNGPNLALNADRLQAALAGSLRPSGGRLASR